MSYDLSSDDKSMIERALRAQQNPNRRRVPAHKVKLFMVMMGDELKRSGSLKQEFVDQLLEKLYSGAL